MEATQQRVGIIGAGTMGIGVARLCLEAELAVDLTDVAPQALETAEQRLRAAYPDADLAVGDFDTAVCRADVVIDATPQFVEPKRQTISAIARTARADAVLGTITLVVPLAKLDPTGAHAGRLLGFHFMNPPHKLRFCELVVRDGVGGSTLEDAERFLSLIGVRTIRTADTPGFVLNALLVPFLMSAARMLEARAATAEAIDLTFTVGCGHPMGPLAVMDLLGLDAVVRTADELRAELGPASGCEPPQLLRDLAASGGALHPHA